MQRTRPGQNGVSLLISALGDDGETSRDISGTHPARGTPGARDVRAPARGADTSAYVSGQSTTGHFRYAAGDSHVFQVLKSVCVVSGLHAAIPLVQLGFHQECAAVLRSVSEALQDIDVVDEAHYSESGPTEYQQQLVDEFFSNDDAQRVQEIAAGKVTPIRRVSRKKKRAAVERLLSVVPTKEPLRPALDAVDAMLDGYVHCGYAQVMQLYSASAAREGFHMRGISSRERHALMAAWVPRFVHHALNAIARLLRDAKHPEDADKVIELRKRIESSSEYEKP
jgi:hypothetical protein